MPPPPAPDGGLWAYTAVFACFMGNVIGDGVMYSFGIFMPKFKEHFGVGSAEISTVNSIQMGVTFASGPIASYMTNKLGWRLTTVIGSVLASAGLALSSIAPNVIFLYFSAGVLVGLGLGIIYLPRLDCITQYFDKRRPFVTGIAICGSGIGTFLFAPLTEWLMTKYSWQTALLIISVICISNCFFGLLFKPLPKYEEEPETCQAMLSGKEELEQGKEEETKDTFRDMVLLLMNWVFMMFAVSNFLTSLGYPIPYTFVPDNAKQHGLTGLQGSSLIGTIGITNTIARIFLGIISLKLDRLFLYNTCLVICGFAMCLTNLFQPIMATITGETCPTTHLFNATLEGAYVLSRANLDNPQFVMSEDAYLSNSTIEAALPHLAKLDGAFLLSNNTLDAVYNNGMFDRAALENSFFLLNSTLPISLPVNWIAQPGSWVCDQYIGQMIYANLYGVTSAAYVLLTTLVLADLLGAEAFTNAFGLLLLFQGIATFIGPPIVGAMFDAYGSYDFGFLIMGIMIALSGAMLYPIPVIKRCISQRNPKKGGIELE